MIPGPACDHHRRPGHRRYIPPRPRVDFDEGAGTPGGGYDPWHWMKTRRDKGWNPKRRKIEKHAKRMNRRRR